ncbi:glycosyltransferase [Pedobacter sp. P351]|uniref:glycosyltransferase family 2 protein n=1 Tax=Pedobacter superstes TaxID=3133441 RepID=UPI0030AA8617
MNTIKVAPINDQDIVRPLWSVIIPTFNCSQYLKETIESVLMQDPGVENMEIWVVDDCSQENPKHIVDDLGKGRINFYRQERNVGQLNNFNTCLNLAKGKIIHLLHGDDFVHAGFYESLKTIVSNNNIGAGFTGHYKVNQTGAVLNSSQALATSPGVIEDFLALILKKQVIETPSIVVKREVYEKLGAFNKDLSWVEDWEMWVRIACKFKFYYEPAHLASYRVHDSSNTADSIITGRFIEDAAKAIKVISVYLNFPENKKKQLINSSKEYYLNYAIHQGIYRKSWRILSRCTLLVYNFSSALKLLKYFTILLKVRVKNFLPSQKKKRISEFHQ